MSAKNQFHLPNIVRHGLVMWLDTQYDSSIQPYSKGEGITWIDLSSNFETEETNPNDLLRTGIKTDVSYPEGSEGAFGPGFTGGQIGGQIDGRALGVDFTGRAGGQLTLPKNGEVTELGNTRYGSSPFFLNNGNPVKFPGDVAWTVELWFNANAIGHNQGLICGCPYIPQQGQPKTPFVNVDTRRVQPLNQEDSFFSIRYKNRGYNDTVSNVIKIGFGNGEGLNGDPDFANNRPIKWYETANDTQTSGQWTHLVVVNDPDLERCSGATTRDAGIRVWINGVLDTPSYQKNFACTTDTISQRSFYNLMQWRIGMAEIESFGAGDNEEPIGEISNRFWTGEIGCVRAYNFAFEQTEVDQNFRETSYRFGQRRVLGLA